MPLVRISYATQARPEVRNTVSVGVHRAMIVTFDVPEDDYFQVITEHAADDSIVGPKEFLGIHHSSNMVFVQITCSFGRTLDQKRALYATIAKNLAANAGFAKEDVVINLVETARENWSFGNGVAAFV